jgi:hypothetical protein
MPLKTSQLTFTTDLATDDLIQIVDVSDTITMGASTGANKKVTALTLANKLSTIGNYAPSSHTHPTATVSANGFLSSSDKVKLDGIAAGAEVNVQADWNATSGDAAILNKPTTFTPSTHSHDNATTSAAGFMSTTDKTKLDGIASGAEVNVQADWNATAGDAFIQNKPGLATTSADGFMSSTDKTKLDGIASDNTIAAKAYGFASTTDLVDNTTQNFTVVGFNVSSVVWQAEGVYRVNFNSAVGTDNNYTVLLTQSYPWNTDSLINSGNGDNVSIPNGGESILSVKRANSTSTYFDFIVWSDGSNTKENLTQFSFVVF